MREILFRGKRLDNGQWIASGNIIRFNPECGEDPVFIPGLNEKCTCTHDEFDNIIAFDKVAFYKVNPETVGQFTGLTDKNGKLIFEGDIVKHYCEHKADGIISIGVVFWDEKRCMFLRTSTGGNATPQIWSCCEYEVIGNIHDNPELMDK